MSTTFNAAIEDDPLSADLTVVTKTAQSGKLQCIKVA